jgi:hypothetical protein
VFDDMGEILPGGQVISPGCLPTPGCRSGWDMPELEEEHHAPMCVTLFIETNAGDLPTREQDRKRHAHAARRGRSGP